MRNGLSARSTKDAILDANRSVLAGTVQSVLQNAGWNNVEVDSTAGISAFRHHNSSYMVVATLFYDRPTKMLLSVSELRNGDEDTCEQLACEIMQKIAAQISDGLQHVTLI